MKRMKKRKGFTIVELVIVIAVIAILATTLVPTFGNVIQNAQDTAAKQEAKNAFTSYMVANAGKGELPEYMVYEADGRFVALHNGAAMGVYGSAEEALKSMAPNADPDKLVANGKLWVYGVDPIVDPTQIDLFVFAGQSNMMGAPATEPTVTDFTDKALEYKYMPKLRGQATGNFVSAQNPAGEWHYKDLNAAYGENLNDLSYKSVLNTYSANTYFCPAMSNPDRQGFATQSEASTFAGPSLAPYFVTEYAEKYGHSSVYAHMAKGGVQITHYFTAEMNAAYNELIDAYNAGNGTSYRRLSAVSGAGTAFDDKYNSMLEDYAASYTDKTVKNKCFVWLQGESNDGDQYIEYKLKMEVLWDHLQELGFTHFFVLRVGYWGDEGILNVMKAQEDFCAENENCYIVTRAPSLIPYPGATTNNWWLDEPAAEYDNCRDSYLVGSGNHHFNERAFQLFAERSAENVHRILHLGLDPILEEENIQGMVATEEEPEEPVEPIEPEGIYTSYKGLTDFSQSGVAITAGSTPTENKDQKSACATELIPVTSTDRVWISQVFFKSDYWAAGGFYDEDGVLVASLSYRDFGFEMDGNTAGNTAFKTPNKANRISIAAIEEQTGKKIAYVRFVAWSTSADGKENTEARIYHDADSTPYTAYVGTEYFKNGLSVSKPNGVWTEKSSSSAQSTDWIPVTSTDSVWIQYVFYTSEAHAVGGFYDEEGNLIAPLYYKDFGLSQGNASGAAAFQTPATTNRVCIADVEAATGKTVAYVRFSAWAASAGGHNDTEARICHASETE